MRCEEPASPIWVSGKAATCGHIPARPWPRSRRRHWAFLLPHPCSPKVLGLEGVSLIIYMSYIRHEIYMGGPMGAPHLLVHNPKDNVGVVVVEGLKAGTQMLCVITDDNSDFKLEAKQDVPIGHKIALRDLSPGDTVIKYGEDIGRIVERVGKGEHVHVHNLKTKRW